MASRKKSAFQTAQVTSPGERIFSTEFWVVIWIAAPGVLGQLVDK
jgi:hypothetical protein